MHANKTNRRQLIIPNDLFFEDVMIQLSEGKRVRFMPKGRSMLPLIRDAKDEIVLASLGDELSAGMIVLAELTGKRYVIHRIEKIDGKRVTLRGDGNVVGREHCLVDNVLAKVDMVVRGKRKIREGGFVWNLYRNLWPKKSLPRKVILAVYRRVFR